MTRKIVSLLSRRNAIFTILVPVPVTTVTFIRIERFKVVLFIHPTHSIGGFAILRYQKNPAFAATRKFGSFENRPKSTEERRARRRDFSRHKCALAGGRHASRAARLPNAARHSDGSVGFTSGTPLDGHHGLPRPLPTSRRAARTTRVARAHPPTHVMPGTHEASFPG